MSIFQNHNTKWVRIQMSKQQKMSRLSKTSTFYETLSWLNKKLQKLTFQRFLLRLQSLKKPQNKSQIHILDYQTQILAMMLNLRSSDFFWIEFLKNFWLALDFAAELRTEKQLLFLLKGGSGQKWQRRLNGVWRAPVSSSAALRSWVTLLRRPARHKDVGGVAGSVEARISVAGIRIISILKQFLVHKGVLINWIFEFEFRIWFQNFGNNNSKSFRVTGGVF